MECITEHPAQSETLSEAASEVRLVYEVFQKREVIPDPIPKAGTRLIEMEKQRSDTKVAATTNGVNGHQISEKEWRKDSCILVMGSVKAGKSTTINLFSVFLYFIQRISRKVEEMVLSLKLSYFIFPNLKK